jgi:hypothetical protein
MDEAAPWKGGLMARWQFAMDLMADRIGGTHVPLEDLLQTSGATTPAGAVDAFAMALLSEVPDAKTQSALLSLASRGSWPEGAGAMVAGLLASPAFQWR